MSWSAPIPHPDNTAVVLISSEIIKSKINMPWHDAERVARAAYAAAYPQAKRDAIAELEKAKGDRP